jgi:hypothetical protein
LVRPDIGENEKVVEDLMAFLHGLLVKDASSDQTKPASTLKEVLEVAEQDESLLHRALKRLACGVVGEDPSCKEVLVPFHATEIIRKLNNSSKIDTIPQYLATVLDTAPMVSLKAMLRRMCLVTGYARAHPNLHARVFLFLKKKKVLSF